MITINSTGWWFDVDPHQVNSSMIDFFKSMYLMDDIVSYVRELTYEDMRAIGQFSNLVTWIFWLSYVNKVYNYNLTT